MAPKKQKATKVQFKEVEDKNEHKALEHANAQAKADHQPQLSEFVQETVTSSESAKKRYLHTLIRANDALDLFIFCDPGATFCLNSEFEDYIIRHLKEGNPDRIFFMPHNHDYHWILVLIWYGEIFILNPLPHSTTYPHLEKSVSSALHSFNIQAGRGNKLPRVKYLNGCPKQPGGFECGYVVMRYMKDIVGDSSLSFEKKWAAKSRSSYGEKNLNEVRFETLDYIQSHM